MFWEIFHNRKLTIALFILSYVIEIAEVFRQLLIIHHLERQHALNNLCNVRLQFGGIVRTRNVLRKASQLPNKAPDWRESFNPSNVPKSN